MNKYLGPPMFIGIVSVIAYLIVYIYEIGYTSFFGIPQDLISINLDVILRSGIIILLILWFLFSYLNSLYVIFKYVLKFPNLILIRPSFWLGLLFLGLVFVIRIEKTWFIGILTIVIIFIFFDFIFPLISQKNVKGYLNKLAKQEEIEKEFLTLYDLVLDKLIKNEKYRLFFRLSFILILITCYVTYICGWFKAKNQKQFYVVNTNPEKVVLRIYGNNLICSEFDMTKKLIKREFNVIKIDSNYILRLEKMGPLRPTES